MKLVVGLGNPGKEYENTRHNIGYQVLDNICKEKKLEFNNKKFDALYLETNIDNEKVIMIKPLSYMNLSGKVVKKYLDYYKINLDDLLIIHDDLDMELGKIKIVYDSTSGGHNGIKDIEKYLDTDKYKRLKIGISNNKDIETKDYVLSKFSKEEQEVLNKTYEKLINFVEDVINYNLNELMNKYNSKNF